MFRIMFINESGQMEERDSTPEEDLQFELDISKSPPASPRHITKLAFRNRFTTVEKVAIDLAGIDNPSESMNIRQQSAMIRVAQADMAAASYIDLDRPDTRQGVIILESAGILSPGRALEILDTEVLEIERATREVGFL